MGVIIMLSSCSSSQLESYKDTQPQLKLEEYFNGPLKAWGMVQGRTGKVNRRFEVDMVGQWQGDTGKLHEKFHFYDGERMERTWTIRKLADGTYEGTAGDVIGKAGAWALPEVGFLLHPDYWGQGLAQEAMRAVNSSSLEENSTFTPRSPEAMRSAPSATWRSGVVMRRAR
jgi:hypothetical protein